MSAWRGIHFSLMLLNFFFVGVGLGIGEPSNVTTALLLNLPVALWLMYQQLNWNN